MATAKPTALALDADNIPSCLTEIPHWVVWRWYLDGERWTKPPYQTSGRFAKTDNPATWTTFQKALAAYQRGKYDGIGLCLADGDGLVGIDIDKVIAADGGIDERATAILDKFSGTYCELSPSGNGYRIFAYGTFKRDGKGTVWKGLETYVHPSNRYLTLTGHAIAADTVTEQQAALDWLYAAHFAPATAEPELACLREPAAQPSTPSLVSVSERLALALRNRDISRLYAGDIAGYPSRSEAECALVLRLLTFADGDKETVAAWLNGSQCSGWLRPSRDSYRQHTLDAALKVWDGVLFSQHPKSTDTSAKATPAAEPAIGGATSSPESDNATYHASTWIRGSVLVQKEFAMPTWILPDMLPDTGLFLLSGKPKSGKSWLALALAMAVAQQGQCLGRAVAGGRVLYLALEDNQRRLKERMLKLQPDCAGNPNQLSESAFATEFPRLGQGAEPLLDKALAAGGVRLVVVDTLQKIRAIGGGANQYEADYGAISALKRLADTYGVCILVVHHTRKMEADDVHDSVSGTLGLTGAADGSLVLVRQRGDGGAVLAVTGRDMPEGEYGLRFDNGLWTFAGSAEEVKASAEQNAILEALRGYGSEGATAATLATELSKKPPAVKFLLRKLVDKGLVRVRNVKPAPFYALCDGPTAETVDCPKCHGSGNVGYGKANGKCFECDGSGKVAEQSAAEYRQNQRGGGKFADTEQTQVEGGWIRYTPKAIEEPVSTANTTPSSLVSVEESSKGEKPLTPLTPLTALTPLTPLTPTENSVETGKGVSGVSLEADTAYTSESRLNTGESGKGVSGVSGVSGDSGTWLEF